MLLYQIWAYRDYVLFLVIVLPFINSNAGKRGTNGEVCYSAACLICIMSCFLLANEKLAMLRVTSSLETFLSATPFYQLRSQFFFHVLYWYSLLSVITMTDSDSETECYNSSDGQSDFDVVDMCQTIGDSSTPVASTSGGAVGVAVARARPDLGRVDDSDSDTDTSGSSTDEVSVYNQLQFMSVTCERLYCASSWSFLRSLHRILIRL